MSADDEKGLLRTIIAFKVAAANNRALWQAIVQMLGYSIILAAAVVLVARFLTRCGGAC